MNKNKIFFLSVALLGLLSACTQKDLGSAKQNNNERSDYISIDGLWKCTPETALKLEDLTLEPLISISGETSNKLSVEACFIWEGQFRDYWWLSGIEYCDSSNQIIIQDKDGSTYIGVVDKSGQKITGTMYSGNEGKLIPEDKLDFIRASDFNTERLFIPRKPNADGSIRYRYEIPEALNDQLKTASIFEYINDTNALYELFKRIIRKEYGRIESFLIVKNEKLVLEEYFYNYSHDDLHNIFSCTKSIVSLASGIALEKNGIKNTDQSIFDVLPQFRSLRTEENKEITLKHILTMTAGFEKSEKYKTEKPERIINNILSLDLETKPGEKFQYNSESPYLLGGIVHSLSGKTISEFTKEKLFIPMGIEYYDWKEENGNPHCESHLHMRPRDMAKIGVMLANNGNWNGKQLVPETWITESVKPHVAESDFFDYGFLWWHRSKSNKSWWKESSIKSNEHDMFLALGYGGQYIFVIKDLDLIITMTSSDYNESNGMAFKKIPMVIDEIVPLFK